MDYLNDPGDETAAFEATGEGMEFGEADLPPEGDYEMVVMSATAGRSKSSGAPQIVLNLSSLEHPGCNSRYYMTNTPAARWRFDRDLRALGLEPPTREKPLVFRSEDFVGKKVMAKCSHNTYNGVVRFRADEIYPTVEGPGARAFGAHSS